MSLLRRSLADPHDFTLTFELVPGRSARTKEYSRTLALARELAADGRLQAVSITENAGGHPALSPEVLGAEARAMGLDVLIHLSCKDKNRNQMESLLYAWDRQDLHNLLVLTGDYPQRGHGGVPKPVFDLGSVQALDLLGRLNRGESTALQPAAGRPAMVPPTAFCKGVVVSPFKRLEAEQMMQYAKLQRKVAAGADFVITQLGYDARKFQEVLFFMQEHGIDLPVLGNVFIPNLKVAELMHQGKVPGCVIPEPLYRLLLQEASAADRGKGARLQRAAKLLAVLKGLGFQGAHLGGPGLAFRDLDFLFTEMERLAGNWQEYVAELSFWPADGFYLYEKERETGLNRPVRREREKSRKVLPAYALGCRIHRLAFQADGPLYQPLRNLCRRVDRSPALSLFSQVEHGLKFLAFGCRNCGDCTLAELGFLCPQAGCAKYLLNGPCGGSLEGWCEVYPGRKRCLYVRLYERLRQAGREGEMAAGLVPPRNWGLDQTSSWLNFFLGRDHAGREEKQEKGER